MSKVVDELTKLVGQLSPEDNAEFNRVMKERNRPRYSLDDIKLGMSKEEQQKACAAIQYALQNSGN